MIERAPCEAPVTRSVRLAASSLKAALPCSAVAAVTAGLTGQPVTAIVAAEPANSCRVFPLDEDLADVASKAAVGAAGTASGLKSAVGMSMRRPLRLAELRRNLPIRARRPVAATGSELLPRRRMIAMRAGSRASAKAWRETGGRPGAPTRSHAGPRLRDQSDAGCRRRQSQRRVRVAELLRRRRDRDRGDRRCLRRRGRTKGGTSAAGPEW